MNIDNEKQFKVTFKRHALTWLFGLILSMVIGAAITVHAAGDLMLEIGYNILILKIIAGAFKGALAYFSVSVGLLGLLLLAYQKLDRDYPDGFAFMRGFVSAFMFYVCWSGLHSLIEDSPKTVGQLYKNMHEEFTSIPLTVLTIFVSATILGMVTKFISDRTKVNQ